LFSFLSHSFDFAQDGEPVEPRDHREFLFTMKNIKFHEAFNIFMFFMVRVSANQPARRSLGVGGSSVISHQLE
jgi:hypothetical protein